MTNIRSLARFVHFPALIFLGGVLMAIGWPGEGLAAYSGQNALATRTPVPAFLYPPYPGLHKVSAIFDHNFPNYDAGEWDNLMVVSNGRQATCPTSTSPDVRDQICYYDNPYTQFGYDDHDGIDFTALRTPNGTPEAFYLPVFAAANADHIIAVGWHSPEYHDIDLGLRVIL